MHIRITTDPMTMKDISDPETHPCVYEGDGNDGLEIYFETEQSRDQYMKWQQDIALDHHIALQGNDSDEYIAEG
ncbi:MAG: hypothetical protein OEY43_08405 [Gammaproteobacteria bacterium]|nr:hypothetical protein [Gammaproteobacteria bacterium]